MNSFRSKPIGWQRDSYRHFLAAKYGSARRYNMVKTYPEKVDVPSDIESLAKLLKDNGARDVYAVGGYVRDKLIGKDPKDLDIEVHGMTPEEIEDVLKEKGYKVNAVGKSFGVLKVRVGSEDIDVAVPRTDSSGRKPDVELLKKATPQEAARRRDFTMNAVMYDITGKKIVDPYGGIKDIEADVVKMVDKGAFADDPLRVARAAQFAARFGFKVDPATVEAAKVANLKDISSERVRDELQKAMAKSKKPSQFFNELDRMGQLERVFPEIAAMKGVQQSVVHHPEGDVYSHTMEVLDRAAEKGADNEVMLASLLHDTGKVHKTVKEGDKIKAHGHEDESAVIAKKFFKRLKFDKKTGDDVTSIVKFHMRPHMMVRGNATGLKHINRALVDVAGSSQSLMHDPVTARRRFEQTVELAKLDANRDIAKYDELEESVPSVQHYQQKVDVKPLMEKGLQGPELGKAIQERYVSKIGQKPQSEVNYHPLKRVAFN